MSLFFQCFFLFGSRVYFVLQRRFVLFCFFCVFFALLNVSLHVFVLALLSEVFQRVFFQGFSVFFLCSGDSPCSSVDLQLLVPGFCLRFVLSFSGICILVQWMFYCC